MTTILIMKALKKIVLKKHLKKGLKFVGSVVDNAALGGAITKTVQETETSKSGEIPYIEIISSLVPVVLLIAVLAGWVSVDEVKELLKLF